MSDTFYRFPVLAALHKLSSTRTKFKHLKVLAALGLTTHARGTQTVRLSRQGRLKRKRLAKEFFFIILPKKSQPNSDFPVLPNFRVGILDESFLTAETRSLKTIKALDRLTYYPSYRTPLIPNVKTVEIHLSGIIGMASHPD